MTPNLHLSESAVRDIEEAAGWYEERESGVGERFLRSLHGRFEHILRDPALPRPFGRRPVRKSSLPGWPYSIYYRLLGEQVRVIAVVHTARDPKYLNYRLR